MADQDVNGTAPTKACKKCKASIPKYADTCPQCGANLKPVYKKGWFWVLIVLLVLVVGAVGCVGSCSSSVSSSLDGPQASGSSAQDTSNLAVGQTLELDNGLQVTVVAVEHGVVRYDGSEATRVQVTYLNNGKKDESFNTYDWKAQDAAGAQRMETYTGNEENKLNSGSLATGGTVTGNLYFEGNVTKALYYSSIANDKPVGTWNI